MTATPTLEVKSPSTGSVSEDESMVDVDNTISATIAVAANVADFRVAANFAQVMWDTIISRKLEIFFFAEICMCTCSSKVYRQVVMVSLYIT